jgi:hypothetical protein
VRGVLTPMDDYPIHQTAFPVAHVASGDPNHYDRYFYNGYRADASLFFGAAMGLYPNRQVIDASFSVVVDGVQHNVYASGRCPLDRSRTSIGPVTIEIVEPLRINRLLVDAPDQGLRAELTWAARTQAIEEPVQTKRNANVLVLEYTRLAQWGTWAGWIEIDGKRIDVERSDTLGTKDKSWGIRPVGAATPGAPNAGWFAGGGLFWLWAPVHWDDECTHLGVFEHPDGRRWFESASRIPLLTDGDPVWGQPERIIEVARFDRVIEWKPGTRRAQAARFTYWPHRGGEPETLTFEPLLDFQMKGIGYTHPTWGHGNWHGELALGGDSWKLDDLDPVDPSNIHVQALCRVTRNGGRQGIGVLEQLVFGPHEPTGLTGIIDGFA